jgi:hypothetical protein
MQPSSFLFACLEPRRGRAFRRAMRARAIIRALSKGPCPQRLSPRKLWWQLHAPDGAPRAQRVLRHGDRPLGHVFAPRVVHECVWPRRPSVERYVSCDFSDLREAMAAATPVVCACPTEPWTRFPPTTQGFFWVVVGRVVPVARALSPSRAAAERCQRQRTTPSRWQNERDFALLYTRHVKLPRARALGIDWRESEWDDELSPETRDRKLPRDARRYPR